MKKTNKLFEYLTLNPNNPIIIKVINTKEELIKDVFLFGAYFCNKEGNFNKKGDFIIKGLKIKS